jgi:hypothetical protein
LIDMKFWIAKQFVRLGGAGMVLVSAGWMVASLTAGEAIQFSNAKSRPEPGVQNKLAKDKLSTLDRIPSSNPLDSVNANSPVGDDRKRPKTREEKRRALAKVEDENWTQVDKGQLQEEEEEKTAFGVRDYDVETGGKEKTTTDIWFSTKNNNNGRSSGNARASGAPARGSAPNRARPAAASEDTGTLKVGKTGGKQTESSILDPPSNERSLQNILAPEPGAGKLNDVFGGPAGDQTARGDLGLRSIETFSGTRAPGLGGGDTLGFGRDLGVKPTLSGSPLLMDSPKSQPSGLFTPSGGSGFGLSGSRFGSPALGDVNSTPRGGFGSTPSLQPQQPSPLTPGSSDPFARPTRPSSGR